MKSWTSMYSRFTLSTVSCAALCIALASCGGEGDKAAYGANGVPDVADASAVPDVEGGNSSAGSDAGMRELEAYRLSMNDVKKWGAASANLARLAEKLRPTG